MAMKDFDAWVPVEYDSNVINRVNQTSAVEALAKRITMGSDTKSVPKSGAVDVSIVPKGTAYPEDSNAADEVILNAKKFGTIVRIAEEDLGDALPDVISNEASEWAVSYAKELDNACLGVTAASNGTTVPFTSVYKSASDASNVTQTGSAGVTYAGLSAVLGGVEGGDYYVEDRVVIIAHPSFKGVFRGLVDDNSRPLFVEGLAGTPSTLFGHQVAWSLGARTSATATSAPTGNPLLIVANRDHLLLGVRSGPESMVSEEASFTTDEHLLKLRSRRGFGVGQDDAIAVLENNA